MMYSAGIVQSASSSNSQNPWRALQTDQGIAGRRDRTLERLGAAESGSRLTLAAAPARALASRRGANHAMWTDPPSLHGAPVRLAQQADLSRAHRAR